MNKLHQTENILNRMVRAVEKVRDRLNRAASALEAADISYAVVEGNAVAALVATVDESLKGFRYHGSGRGARWSVGPKSSRDTRGGSPWGDIGSHSPP